MFDKILKSPLTWAITAVVLQVLISVFSSSDVVTLVASSVLMLSALFIWKLEKYQSEMPLNRYAMAFAVGTIIMMLMNLWFYSNVAAKFQIG